MALDSLQDARGSCCAAEGGHGRLLLSSVLVDVPQDLRAHGLDYLADSHTA